MSERLRVNVSGRLFEVSHEVLARFPNSTLSEAARAYEGNHEEIFFERPVVTFEAILTYYQTKELHIPTTVCPATFKTELDYWGFSPNDLEPCCRRNLARFCREQEDLEDFERRTTPPVLWKDEKIYCCNSFCQSGRKYLWILLNDPFSSRAAKVYFFVAAVFIVTSSFLLVASTHKAFRHKLTKSEWAHYFGSEFPQYRNEVERYTQTYKEGGSTNFTLPTNLYSEYSSFHVITIVSVVFFTVELLVKFVCCPRKLLFFKSVLNIVDTLSVIVACIEVVVNEVESAEKYKNTYLDILQCLQILRVLRLYRLTEHVTGARILMYAVTISANELAFMGLLIAINTVLFATLVYFCDTGNMKSIPEACWWAVITMTTVGYGDIVPSNLGGKLVGILCAAMGILIIAITVPLFVNNFLCFYNYANARLCPSKRNKGSTSPLTQGVFEMNLDRNEKDDVSVVHKDSP